MNPLEVWYLIERGHKPAEFLAGFVGDRGVWSTDRTVAMCWKADADAKACLARHKEADGFQKATIGIISPAFARNLQPPGSAPPPAPEPVKEPKATRTKASKAPKKAARKGR